MAGKNGINVRIARIEEHVTTLNSEMGETRDEMKSMNKCVETVSEKLSRIDNQISAVRNDLWWIKWVGGAAITLTFGLWLFHLFGYGL